MIKVIFELDKEFIANNANEETISAKMKAAEGTDFIKVLFETVAFTSLFQQVELGKTEFVVTPDKLDVDLLKTYNSSIAEICLLAASSEKDKKNGKEEHGEQ